MRTPLLLLAATMLANAQTIGIDTHIDTPQRVLIEGVDLTQRLKSGQVDIPRLKEGGMNAPFFALWVPTFYKPKNRG
jgi:membrane dipeptidase